MSIDSGPIRPEPRLRPAAALRDALAEGYGRRTFLADLSAGAVVGVVALPLSMALAIASGVPPQHGLYTAIIGGGLIALLGGSRVQVAGPTAAFVVLLAPVSAEYGPGGLLVASLLAGVMLVLMGVSRLGKLVEFIPHPVTTGFTAGIGLVIATLQLEDLMGLQVAEEAQSYLQRVAGLARALPTIQPEELLTGLATLAVLIFFPKVTRKIPAPLVALSLAGLAAFVLARFGVQLDTIGSRFEYTIGDVTGRGVPRLPPMPMLPWNMEGPGGVPLGLSWSLIGDLLPKAFAIAMLGAIESLLSAVVADGMAGTTHDPDAELLGQGIGNIVAPFFGGFAATGAIARTATNVRAGAKTPFASFFHAIFILMAVLLLAPLVAWLPMAGLAALLLVVAWNMSDVRHMVRVVKEAPRSDVLVLATCFLLTVLVDMVWAVGVGVVLASLLFMRRMAELAGGRLLREGTRHEHGPLPKGVVVYEIAGPLFFGAAHKAMSALREIHSGVHTVVLDLSRVPAIDATGLINLESALSRLSGPKRTIVLVGLRRQPRAALEKAGIVPQGDRLVFLPTVAAALSRIGADPAPSS